MIHDGFPELEGILAVGLAGAGSECFGYDDAISQDHDFEPGFCIFVPDGALDSRTLFRLERAYASLPKEYLGFERQPVSPVGGNRRGIILQGDFLAARTGHRDGVLSPHEWMRLPEQYLFEAVGGEIFRDDAGAFSAARERLSQIPHDVRLKKIAGHLLLMAQSGQYNYPRAARRGDNMTSQLAAYEFAFHTAGALFSLAGRYMPYYKWRSRAMSELPLGERLSDILEYLITTDNDKKTSAVKAELMDDVARIVTDELRSQSLTEVSGYDLEHHAYSCNDKIEDTDIRNLNVLYAVD